MEASNSEGILPPNLVQRGDLLIISQLVGVQQALFEGRIRVALRRMLHYIQDKADSLLDEGRDQVLLPGLLLPFDAMKAETGSQPAHWLVHPEGW